VPDNQNAGKFAQSADSGGFAQTKTDERILSGTLLQLIAIGQMA
jgi:hypothetical protein